MADLWCSLVEALWVDLVKFLSEIFSASFLCSVILVPSLFKASDTFNVFQVLIKMTDSHRNCQHH